MSKKIRIIIKNTFSPPVNLQSGGLGKYLYYSDGNVTHI